jgi:hypothetical protein
MTATPAAYAVECKPSETYPRIEVTAERGQPNFSYAELTANLTQKSTDAYRPQGVGGPAWHTSGLTQSNIRIEENVQNHTITAADGSYGCLYIDSIAVKVILAPVVWVADEFPQGSCMYGAVKDHEMKHVNADRVVTDRHLDKIRAALYAVSQGRVFFGPGRPDDVKAQFEAFMASVKDAMKTQTDDFYADEQKAQHAIDTMQEYHRISALCAQQLKGMN